MASASDNPSVAAEHPGVAADVHLMHLLGTNCAGQLHYDSPLHPVSPVFLIPQVVPRSERDPQFSDGLKTSKARIRGTSRLSPRRPGL